MPLNRRDWLEKSLHDCALALPMGSPPVPVAIPVLGPMGLANPGRGFERFMPDRQWEALWRDEERFLRTLLLERRVKHATRIAAGLCGLMAGLPLLAISSWNDVVNARAAGKSWETTGTKASQATLANNWSCFYRSSGAPPTGSYTNIPGGAVHAHDSAGAWPLGPLVTSVPSGEKAYILNVGVNHLSGPNLVMVVDLLVAAGNINANVTGAQTVNTVALTRYTSGEGVMMILEVTTALGGTGANVTVTYTNQAGTSGQSTGAIAMTASAITFRLQPVQDGAIIRLAAGDFGVRSVQTIEFSAAMGAGVVAILLYKPLVLMPTLSATTWVARSTPSQVLGIEELVKGTDNKFGCLTFFVLTVTSSTGGQTYIIETLWG